MSRKPGWLPDLDVDLLSDIIQENLQDLTDIPVGDFLSVSQGPAAVALGTVLGALTGQKAVEIARKLDIRIQKFVEEDPDDRVYLSRIARVRTSSPRR